MARGVDRREKDALGPSHLDVFDVGDHLHSRTIDVLAAVRGLAMLRILVRRVAGPLDEALEGALRVVVVVIEELAPSPADSWLPGGGGRLLA